MITAIARRPVVLSFGIVVALGVAVAVLITRQPTEAVSHGATFAGLSCGPGELRGVNHRDLNPLVPGATTPDVALERYLMAEMPDLKVTGLTLISVASDAAQFAYLEAGKPVAFFDLVNFGSGWRFSGWSACASFTTKHLRAGS